MMNKKRKTKEINDEEEYDEMKENKKNNDLNTKDDEFMKKKKEGHDTNTINDEKLNIIIEKLYEENMILNDSFYALNKFYNFVDKRWKDYNERQEFEFFFDDIGWFMEHLKPVFKYIINRKKSLNNTNIPDAIKRKVDEYISKDKMEIILPSPDEYKENDKKDNDDYD